MKTSHYFYSMLHIYGPDANQFLQGQLTIDMNELNANHAKLAACCNQKGRVVTNFFIFPWQDGYLLILPPDMIEIARAHLGKYAVFSKVTLEAWNKGWKVVGTTKYEKPMDLWQCESDENHIAIKIPGERYLIAIADTGHFNTIEQDDWNRLDVESGLALLTSALSERFIPQMIDLEKFGGVSFTKGCYLGQEVIARAQNLGTLKRHLCRRNLEINTAPKIGAALVDEDGAEMGTIVQVSKQNSDVIVLAVIQDRAADKKLMPDDMKS